METKQKFIEVMGTAAALFDVDLEKKGPVYLDVYWQCMKPFSDQEVARAFGVAMQTLKWMPRPADILEIISGAPSGKAFEAWNCMVTAMGFVGAYRSVVFEDKTIHAVIEAWGGWVEVCKLSTQELRYKTKEFQELYNMYKNQPIDIPKLVGRVEGENILSGFEEHIEEPVKIGFRDGQIRLEHKYAESLLLTSMKMPEPEEEVTETDWEALREAVLTPITK